MRNFFLSLYEAGDEIVSGGCPNGGDMFAEILAKKYQVPIKIYYAQWKKIGRGAGFARNTDIARDSDILMAVVAEDRTGGTEDTVKKFCNKFKKTEEGLIKEKKLIFVPQLDGDFDPSELSV